MTPAVPGPPARPKMALNSLIAAFATARKPHERALGRSQNSEGTAAGANTIETQFSGRPNAATGENTLNKFDIKRRNKAS